MKSLLLAFLAAGLLCATSPADIVVLSGPLTTKYSDSYDNFDGDATNATTTSTRVTEKNYLVLDILHGNYALLRLYRNFSGAKKVVKDHTGLVHGQILPGDARGRTTRYAYFDISIDDPSSPYGPNFTSYAFHLDGIVDADAGASIHIGGPFPPSLKSSLHRTREVIVDYPGSSGYDHSQTTETGKFTLERLLSRQVNDQGLSFQDALTATFAALAKLGYTP